MKKDILCNDQYKQVCAKISYYSNRLAKKSVTTKNQLTHRPGSKISGFFFMMEVSYGIMGHVINKSFPYNEYSF